jgi:hypothetical protein
MLTQLATLKSRLNLTTNDNDALLTLVLEAVSARFDLACHRTLARTVNATYEFSADLLDLRPPCYPLETVLRFDLKASETEGWVQPSGIRFLLRRNCVITLPEALGDASQLGRVTYTGGYVLPGAAVESGQTPLPPALELAALDQAAFWFQRRDQLGVIRQWPKGGAYEQIDTLDLLPSVAAALQSFERFIC